MTVHNYALFFKFWIPAPFFDGKGIQKWPPGFSGIGRKLKRLSKAGKITLASATLFCGAANRSHIRRSGVSQALPEAVTRPARIHNPYFLKFKNSQAHGHDFGCARFDSSFIHVPSHSFGHTVRPEERSTHSSGAAFAD
ncbi:MAG: hypothetical protein ABI690_02975 [Chloroflexota bacterium]